MTSDSVFIFYPLSLRYYSRGTTKALVDHEYLFNSPNDLAHETSFACIDGLIPDVIESAHLASTRITDQRLVLRRVSTCIPLTFNLYLLVPNERSDPTIIEQLQREIARFLITTSLAPKNGRQKQHGGSLCSTQLELVFDNCFAALCSLYDLADVLLKGALRTSINNFSNPCSLYVWRLDDEHTFRRLYRHLLENAVALSHLYQLPVHFDDDVIRFSFDMLLADRDRLTQLKKNKIRSDLLAKLGKHSADNDNSVDAISSRLNNRQRNKDKCVEDMLREYTLDSLNRPAEHREQQHENGLHLYSIFSFGEWCLLRDRIVIRIDRRIFDRVVRSIDSLVSLSQSACDTLWLTPLVLIPSVIWDIETIAEKPGTIPRGVHSSEKLVSVAITVRRSGERGSSLVFALVPHPISESEFLDINSLNLSSGASDVVERITSKPKVLCYREERAMLTDVIAFLSSQPLMYSLIFDLLPDAYSHYFNLATFVVGHNTVGYDFLFLHNRATYFSLSAVAAHLTRNFRKMCNDVANLYTFNDAQLCLDTMLFLLARMRHLAAFDLSSVLKVYHCDVAKGTLDARQIRFFYNALNDQSLAARLNYSSSVSRLNYFTEFLRYNLYDCLSLANLLDKLSFHVFAGTLMQYFHSTFNISCYCGNSRLLPNLIIGDMLQHSREFLIVRQPNYSLVAANSISFDKLFESIQRMLDDINADHPSQVPLVCNFAVQVFPAFDSTSSRKRAYAGDVSNSCTDDDRLFASSSSTYTRGNIRRNFFSCRQILPYARHIFGQVFRETSDTSSAKRRKCHFQWTKNALNLSSDHRTTSSSVPLSDCETDLLRVNEKTYIGGLNFADPCHLKNPFLMDYNSFYPSIIRHYQLDYNNVAVFTVAKLLMLIRSLEHLDALLKSRVIRIFDYTNNVEHDLERFVNRFVFTSSDYADLYEPHPHCPREWYTGVEMNSARLLIASTRHFARRVLVVWRKDAGSTVARIVSDALDRRAVWKAKRKMSPDDRVLESRELMEKLLANGTYGYLNFSRSVIFSRATAAAVTLLCRNAFARTKYIIESDALMEKFGAKYAQLFRAVVNYIDTDGCIVAFVAKRVNTLPASISITATDQRELFKLNCLLDELTLEKNSGDKSIDFSRYSSTICAMKDRFVGLVNDMLDMQHVRLAAEEHLAVAASVFGRKKYTLFKLSSPRIDDPLSSFVLKKTGFEKNAPRPIKSLYDSLLRNVMCMNHLFGANSRQMYVAKIADHRAFLFALFDSLLDAWRTAVREKRVAEFAIKIPLNVRSTGGKLATFIEETLRVHQYDPGDRVQVVRAFPINRESLHDRRCIRSSLTNLETTVYNISDSRIILLDELNDHLDDYFPDLRYFLGGHLTYMYQCVEGYKSLRGGCDLLGDQFPSVEPIGWRDHVARDRLLNAARSCRSFERGNVVVAVADSIDNTDVLCGDSTICLRSLNAISSLFFSVWMWERVLSPVHRATFDKRRKHLLVWREIDEQRLENLLRKTETALGNCTDIGASTAVPLEQQASLVLGDKRVQFLSPAPIIFVDRFSERWLRFYRQASDQEQVDRQTRALFGVASWSADDVSRFYESRVVLYRPV